MPSPHDVRQMHIDGALIELKDALNRVSILTSGATLTLGDRFRTDEELVAVWNQVVEISSKNRAAINRIEEADGKETPTAIQAA